MRNVCFYLFYCLCFKDKGIKKLMSRVFKNKISVVFEKIYWKDLKYFIYKWNCFIINIISRV